MSYDLILVGGGLANCLIAYRLKQSRPNLSLKVIEAGSRFGGNHTWSFYKSDVSPHQHDWLTPFIVKEWAGYDVAFSLGDNKGTLCRHLDTAYCSVSSERLHDTMEPLLGSDGLLNTTVQEVAPDHVVLSSGERLVAKTVIDGRGAFETPFMKLGYQKFVGLEVECETSHGLDCPVVMDACVEQLDGYRFVYCLPFSSTRLLIEDTYYSDTSHLDAEDITRRIHDYAATKGWSIKTIIRQEQGILPITLSGDFDAFWPDNNKLPRSGLRANLFHPTTGYSLPYAVQLADLVASHGSFDSSSLHALIRSQSQEQWQKQWFFRLLNRMLFYAAKPPERANVLRRFYTLPSGLIERFYAGQLTQTDILRILAGKPPVSVIKAVKAMVHV